MPDSRDSPRNQEAPTDAEIEEHINQVGTYSRFVKAGLGVIVGAFLLAVVGRLPYNLASVPSAVDAILLPLIFVGMGLLLFGIGMHLHIMHLNLVQKLRRPSEDEEAKSDSDS
jgi:uncharacterized protein YacL